VRLSARAALHSASWIWDRGNCPLEPLHRLAQALAGFGINAVTGLLAFIGMPEFYTLDYAFWVKLLAILLLGGNAAAFYLTGVFGRVKDLDPAKMPRYPPSSSRRVL